MVTSDDENDDENDDVSEDIGGGGDRLSLLERVEELEGRLLVLENQFDDMRIAEEDRGRGQRYYAVLRGRFDAGANDFVSGIFRTKEEHDGAVLGATRARAKSKSTYEKAVEYYEENIEAVEVENSTFRNELGEYSPSWYLVYPSSSSAKKDVHILPSYEQANVFVKGSSDYCMKRYKTFIEAKERSSLLGLQE